MALIVNYILTCDSCLTLIEQRAQECTADLVIPDRSAVMGMDLCETCLAKVRHAVNEALSIPQSGQPRTLQ